MAKFVRFRHLFKQMPRLLTFWLAVWLSVWSDICSAEARELAGIWYQATEDRIYHGQADLAAAGLTPRRSR